MNARPPRGAALLFLGPSLPNHLVPKLDNLVVLAPIVRGDILKHLDLSPIAIGIIDGRFEDTPSVSHKEILEAVDLNIPVFGASSMGALRAAELSQYGMRGLGRIFEWYKSGEISADDEVALLHGPAEAGYITLTFPLVNLRATLIHYCDTCQFEREVAILTLDIARKIHYKDRTLFALDSAIRASRSLTSSGRTIALSVIHRPWVDQKRFDAQLLVERMCQEIKVGASASERPASTTAACRTSLIDSQAVEYGFAGHPNISDRLFLACAQLFYKPYPHLYASILRSLYVTSDRRWQNYPKGSSQKYKDLRANLDARGIRASDFAAWQSRIEPGLTRDPNSFHLPDQLWTWRTCAGGFHQTLLVTSLKISEDYEPIIKIARAASQRIDEFRSNNPGFDLQWLRDQYVEDLWNRYSPDGTEVGTLARSGFLDPGEFLTALKATYPYWAIASEAILKSQ